MRESLTIAEAARELEVSEGVIRGAIARGEISALEQRGTRRKTMIDRREVALLGRRRQYGKHGPRVRRVVCAYIDGDSVLALRAAGLDVLVEPNIISALSAHEHPSAPILVLPVELEYTELTLLRAIAKDAHVILIGDATRVDFNVASRVITLDPHELRALVQIAWVHVQERIQRDRAI